MIIEYENSDLLVVNKPAGLSVYSTKKHVKEDSVVSWFLQKYPKLKSIGDPERPGVVHRLDKQTSGLLLLAKTNEGFEHLKKLFKDRQIAKEYLALVYGELPKHGIIDKPLSKIGFRGSSRVRVAEEGKQSVTEYWAKEYYKRISPPREGEIEEGVTALRSQLRPPLTPPHEEGNIDVFTFVRITLHTGRTHQIRVHFAEHGHPVMGDDLYGKPKSQALKDILHRQFLHASRLEFQLPDGTWLEVESELSDDLKKVIGNLTPALSDIGEGERVR